MKIYLDDIRNPEFNYSDPEEWTVVRTASEAIDLVDSGQVKVISLDHDLGDNVPTGYEVALRIEELALTGAIKMPEWYIHSANPVGVRRMKAALENADRRQPRLKDNRV